MRRRNFIATLLGAAAWWPLAARAQQGAMPVVGFLNGASPDRYASFVAAFHRGLKELGYTEGENVAVEYRWAEGQYDRLPSLAADLVRHQVAVIAATGGDVSARAAKAATATTPIVFDVGGDPVALGLVASLNRPGGNLTGVSLASVDLLQKRVELLGEMAPNAAVIACLVNPLRASAEAEAREVEAAGRALGRQIIVLHVSNDRDLDRAFATLGERHAGALLVNSDNFLISRRDQIAALAARAAIPALYGDPAFAAAGGLMSYSASLSDAYRRVGVYTGRILKGEKPADLPVEQVSKIELVINAKTAKALGLDIPPSIFARADEVIE